MENETSNNTYERFVNLVAIPAAGVREHPAYDLAYYNNGSGLRGQVSAAPIDVQFAQHSRNVKQRLRINQDWVRDRENLLWRENPSL